jgi:urease beta subunit|tara:strand:- start:1701 stop:1955 length:255 start_codon:yes stop_codon:yes gene_type:complete
MRNYQKNESHRDRKKYKNNTSGHTGVRFDPAKRLWIAVITVKGKKIFIGKFSKLTHAINARKRAEIENTDPMVVMRNLRKQAGK